MTLLYQKRCSKNVGEIDTRLDNAVIRIAWSCLLVTSQNYCRHHLHRRPYRWRGRWWWWSPFEMRWWCGRRRMDCWRKSSETPRPCDDWQRGSGPEIVFCLLTHQTESVTDLDKLNLVKLAYGEKVLCSSQYLLLSHLPKRKMLASKVAKSESKIIFSLLWYKSVCKLRLWLLRPSNRGWKIVRIV